MEPLTRVTWRIGAALTLALCMAGCATLPDAGLASDTPLVAGQGMVALQVVSNTERIGEKIPTWSEAIVEDLDRRDDRGKPILHSIPGLYDGLTSTRVFVGALPPGRYAFRGLFASLQYAGGPTYYASAPAPSEAGRFLVEDGRLTELGTILFQPLHPDALATKMLDAPTTLDYVLTRISDSDALAEFVALKYPMASKSLGQREPLRWEPDALDESREALASAMRAYAIPVRAHPSSGGAVVFTGRLGSLQRRDAGGRWTSLNVSGYRELLAYREVGAEHFVGGERGAVCRATDFVGPYQCASLPNRNQNVVRIDADTSGRVHVLAEERGRYRLYRLDTWPDAFAEVTSFGASAEVWAPQSVLVGARLPAAYRDGDILVVSSVEATHSIDLRNGRRTTSEVPALWEAVEQSNGWIVASPSSTWSGTKPPIVSRDRGRTWKEISRLGVHGVLPYVDDTGDAIGLDNDATYVFVGWRKREKVAVLRAAGGAKENRQIGQLPFGCGELVTEASSDALLLARCHDGAMLRSTDGGASWTVDLARAVRADAVPAEFRSAQGMRAGS